MVKRITCPECNEERDLYAKDLCAPCYRKVWTKRKADNIKARLAFLEMAYASCTCENKPEDK